MIRRLLMAVMVCVLLLGFAATLFAQQPDRNSSPSRAREIAISGAIGPATSHYVVDELEEAAKVHAPLVILRLDTPGGLSGAMREIVQAILASPVPVVSYVGPSGARAASAGTYILYASHIAAMAPATNLGAATPVNLGGDGPAPGDSTAQKNDKKQDQDTPADSATAERRKVVNDAVAYIRSLAEKRDRNADWAERAVREGVSLSAKQALARHVVENIAKNEHALLAMIDGETVETAAGQRTLHTKNLRIQQREPDWRTRFLSIITEPTVAYLLFMIGIYGLILEGLHPGAVAPGVVGAISLLCALYAFQILPINYTGLALMALGMGLIVAEVFAPSFGMLGLGGIAAFVFGSIMLMDTHVPGFEIPLDVIGAIAVASALLLLLILYVFLRSRRARVQTGHQGMIGSQCVALEDFEREGRVLLRGESWLAESETPVARDQPLTVTGATGLKVFVQAVEDTASHSPHTAGPRSTGS